MLQGKYVPRKEYAIGGKEKLDFIVSLHFLQHFKLVVLECL